jgi:hypothetical protein
MGRYSLRAIAMTLAIAIPGCAVARGTMARSSIRAPTRFLHEDRGSEPRLASGSAGDGHSDLQRLELRDRRMEWGRRLGRAVVLAVLSVLTVVVASVAIIGILIVRARYLEWEESLYDDDDW